MLKLLITLIVFFVSYSQSMAKSPFEGKVLMSVSSSEFNGDIDVYVSEYGLRADMSIYQLQTANTLKTSYIVPSDIPDKAYLLMHNTRSVSVMNTSNIHKLRRFNSSGKSYQLQKLGTETLKGYTCQKLEIRSRRDTLQLWLTKDVLDFQTFESVQHRLLNFSKLNLASILKKEGYSGFPIKIIQKQFGGRFLQSQVKQVIKTSVPKKLYQVPPSYKPAEES
jgi:hypothetical protein